MGQKTNPIGNRLGFIKGWDSNWYGGKDYSVKLVEDDKIRKYLNARLRKASVSKIVIERTLKLITITINLQRQYKYNQSSQRKLHCSHVFHQVCFDHWCLHSSDSGSNSMQNQKGAEESFWLPPRSKLSYKNQNTNWPISIWIFIT